MKTLSEIDAALASTGYSCKNVPADYVRRAGESESSVSLEPMNISDAYLKAKDDSTLFTVRSDSWNDKLPRVSADSITLLTGNCDSGGYVGAVSLRQFLQQPAEYGASYTGLNNFTSLSAEFVKIRFETVFLPTTNTNGDFLNKDTTLQFAVETRSNEPQSKDNPRNLILLAMPEGLSVQAEDTKEANVMLHMRSEVDVKKYWLKAESNFSGFRELQEQRCGIGIDALSKRPNDREALTFSTQATPESALGDLVDPDIYAPDNLANDRIEWKGKLTYFLAAPPSRGWQRSEGLLLLHSFLSSDTLIA